RRVLTLTDSNELGADPQVDPAHNPSPRAAGVPPSAHAHDQIVPTSEASSAAPESARPAGSKAGRRAARSRRSKVPSAQLPGQTKVGDTNMSAFKNILEFGEGDHPSDFRTMGLVRLDANETAIVPFTLGGTEVNLHYCE